MKEGQTPNIRVRELKQRKILISCPVVISQGVNFTFPSEEFVFVFTFDIPLADKESNYFKGESL